MKRKHKKTLERIFKKPTRSNVVWTDVESLIVSLGGEIEKGRAGSRVGVFLNGKATIFHRSHPRKEMDKGAVRNLRGFLKLVGGKP